MISLGQSPHAVLSLWSQDLSAREIAHQLGLGRTATYDRLHEFDAPPERCPRCGMLMDAGRISDVWLSCPGCRSDWRMELSRRRRELARRLADPSDAEMSAVAWRVWMAAHPFTARTQGT